MVQVDVFWSYGLASGLALASRKSLQQAATPWGHPGLLYTLLWFALAFAPSGMYLLWEFPAWETMFVARDHNSIPGWIVVLFAITNIACPILGYYITGSLIQKGSFRAAYLQPVWSHLVMLFILLVGWDGTGLQRFTYSGTGEEFAQGVPYFWTDFFSSPVFYTLLAMGVVLVPSYTMVLLYLRKRDLSFCKPCKKPFTEPVSGITPGGGTTTTEAGLRM